MEQIAVETKGNFFESRTVEYQKAKLNVGDKELESVQMQKIIEKIQINAANKLKKQY